MIKKMMKAILMVTLVGVLSATPGAAQPGSLAPEAQLDDKFGMLVGPEERAIPDDSLVGIPAYPGSLFCTVKKGEYGPTGWTEAQLVSTDPYENVSAWYKQKMKGWLELEVNGTRVLHKGPGKGLFVQATSPIQYPVDDDRVQKQC